MATRLRLFREYQATRSLAPPSNDYRGEADTLAIDYGKLTADLRQAGEAARAAADQVEDGGSANLDAVFLTIPRAREEKVLTAIRESGLYCRAKRRWIGDGYMISPNVGGQGDKRAKAAAAMCHTLRERGWDVLLYQQMD